MADLKHGEHAVKNLSMVVILTLVGLGLCMPVAAQNSAWEYDKKTAIDGKVTEIATSLQEAGDRNSATLIIRCKKTCEAYLALDGTIFADQSSVRIKFNESPIKYF